VSVARFSLAGLVAETISGVAYHDLMRNSVFTPLGMERTFFLRSERRMLGTLGAFDPRAGGGG